MFDFPLDLVNWFNQRRKVKTWINALYFVQSTPGLCSVTPSRQLPTCRAPASTAQARAATCCCLDIVNSLHNFLKKTTRWTLWAMVTLSAPTCHAMSPRQRSCLTRSTVSAVAITQSSCNYCTVEVDCVQVTCDLVTLWIWQFPYLNENIWTRCPIISITCDMSCLIETMKLEQSWNHDHGVYSWC